MKKLSDETKRGNWSRRLLAGTAVCFLVSVFLVTQWCFGPFREFTTKRLLAVFSHYFVVCCIWGVLSIAIQSIVNRLGFNRERLVRTVAVYLLIGVAFSGAFILLSRWPLGAIGNFFYGFPRLRGFTMFELLASFNSSLVVFTIILVACLAIGYLRKQRDRELRTSRLETQLTKANLSVLKSQLQPHFLFNSLNTIASFIRENPDAAEEMVVQLSDLLRTTLNAVKQDEVSVKEELDFLQRYINIEKMRFGERLFVEYRIDPEISDALVPNLLLQPLVENSIVHGVARQSKLTTVIISAKRQGSVLCLGVSDTGPGRDEAADSNIGIGLENTIERLKHLYGNQYRIKAANKPQGPGFCVSVEVPLSFLSVAESMK